jgi:hypothetical protein
VHPLAQPMLFTKIDDSVPSPEGDNRERQWMLRSSGRAVIRNVLDRGDARVVSGLSVTAGTPMVLN